MVTPGAIFYYGTALPNHAKARALKNATVVLQPYHPLCRSGSFADYFPDCTRYVYWNPTALDPEAPEMPAWPLPTLGRDETWGIERLDLRRKEACQYALARGHSALGKPTEGVHGLFVDDLDLWSMRDRRPWLQSLLHELCATADRKFAWFVNRGFSFWDDLPGLHAVLLEGLSPGIVDAMPPADAVWITRVVLPSLRRLSRRGVRVFSLTYEKSLHQSPPRTPISQELAALIDEAVLAPRLLQDWPKGLA